MRFRTWLLDATASMLALFAALFSLVKLVRDPSASWLEVTGTVCIAVFAFSIAIVRAFRVRRDEMKFEPIIEPKEMSSWAKGLINRLCTIDGSADADALGVRVVVYKVIWDKTRSEPICLEQTIKYVGGPGGPVGRRSSVHSGIIGRSARMGEVYAANRASDDLGAFREELVDVWGFTFKQALERSTDRWAWFAVPLLQKNNDDAYGVVYLDANRRGFFDNEAIKDAVVVAVEFLAEQLVAFYDRKK